MAALTRFHDAVLDNNVEVAKKLIDDGLDPNGYLEACTCPNSCYGYTLLYMACVHNRMTIAQVLLEAGADPDRRNGNDGISYVHTPFVFVIKQRNHDLFRVLMRESKVRADYQFLGGNLPKWRVAYGLFCEFHEDEDVIKILMNGEFIALGVHHLYRFGNLGNLLYDAAKHRILKVCKVLLNHCGIKRLVDTILEFEYATHRSEVYKFLNYRGIKLRMEHGDWTETMSYLIEVYGARKFVREEEHLKAMIMLYGSTDMLEMLMGCFYQLYGDNNAQWTELMVTSWARRYPHCDSYMHSVMEKSIAFRHDGKSRFDCLLRWGVHNVQRDNHIPSMFFALAKSGMIKSARILINLYPQCLQEEWLQKGRKPWIGFVNHGMEPEMDEYFPTLVEKRHVLTLQIMCRNIIFHNLGINPIPKAERLPLPRILKKLVKCKELFESQTDD